MRNIALAIINRIVDGLQNADLAGAPCQVSGPER
ncbi:hypothetical protein FHW79_005939 [Azospirillum sp. OGB3]|nr:hypothetical protein [Azospirillum sp. OGB3]